jgi:pimeloyl-ACP methyl ester carboxylesterase
MKYLLFAIALFTAQTVFAQNYSDVAGDWTGSIEINGQNLTTDFMFGYQDGELDGTIDIPQQMAFNLPIEFTKAEGDSLIFQFQTGTGVAVFRGTWDSSESTISGIFEQMGRRFPFAIEKIGETITDEAGGSMGTDIAIDTRAGQVSGTLLLADEPSPLVILLNGSGSQDRDETVAGFRVFGQLADSLYKYGYSSFRYDDRGVGRSTGETDATIYDLAEDLEDIVLHLQNEYSSSITETVLLGHSQGGLVATISSDEISIDGIVFMGAPFLPGDEIINSQIQAISEAQGIDEEIVEQNLQFQQRIYEVVRNGDDWDEIEQDLYDRLENQINELPEQQREALGDMNSFIRSQINRQLAAAKTAWFKSFIEYDPQADISSLQIPMLAIFGEKDSQVILDPNRTMAESLKENSDLNLTIVEIESANHLFQQSNTGLPSEYGMLDKEFADGFVEAIIEWLNSI